MGTPGSMNSLFSDFFRKCWRGILGGCSRLFRGEIGRFLEEKNQGRIEETYNKTKTKKVRKQMT